MGVLHVNLFLAEIPGVDIEPILVIGHMLDFLHFRVPHFPNIDLGVIGQGLILSHLRYQRVDGLVYVLSLL